MTSLLDAHEVVRQCSKTWCGSILDLPVGLNEAISCAYLCVRGIDEIEDHSQIGGPDKIDLLRQIGGMLQTEISVGDFHDVFSSYAAIFRPVTLRMGEWAMLPPPEIRPRVLDAISTMAERMATWVDRNWLIRTEQDLNHYAFSVAGSLGLLLSDLWCWYDHTDTNRTHAISFGRALQAVDILVDRTDDAKRGVDFWPIGWNTIDMLCYIDRELELAAAYFNALPVGPARLFCEQPLRDAFEAVDRFRHGIILCST
ncbi:squalene/phytoene synthase family protein [Burkholderia sp. Nafp2/4-1b]|uniref:squalene/phytoene synthase family protein n=1 Tax=Burkholderia sp. Nafp2/4-1b TaxID=2116686 RepID=UPI0013CE8B69|nr:squalene/phytoene synthase family protein [Burkholderia sp. Nafp2/4-1b]